MRLHIARFNPDLETFETIPEYITVLAENCENGKVGEFEKSLDLTVMAGDFIVVEVQNCTTDDSLRVCPFLPVAVTSDNTSCIKYSSDFDFTTTQEPCGTLLAVEAYIEPRKLISYNSELAI